MLRNKTIMTTVFIAMLTHILIEEYKMMRINWFPKQEIVEVAPMENVHVVERAISAILKRLIQMCQKSIVPYKRIFTQTYCAGYCTTNTRFINFLSQCGAK